nr:diguanylate cyclase [Aequitasia blattaphilus]
MMLTCIYLGITIALLFTVIKTAKNKEKGKLEKWFIFTTAMMICWVLCLIYELFGGAQDYKLPFIALSSLGCFCYGIHFFGLGSYLSKQVVYALLVPPLVTAFVAFTPFLAFTKEVQVPWFGAHVFYCNILPVSVFIIALIQFQKMDQRYRVPSALLLIGAIVNIITNGMVLVLAPRLDIMIIGRTITVVFLYVAMNRHKELEAYLLSQKNAFNCIDRIMFFLDNKQQVVTMNGAALKWLESQDICGTHSSFGEIEKELVQKATHIECCDNEDEGTDYSLIDGEVYNLRHRDILDKEGSPIGCCVYVTNKTTNRRLVEELDKVSGMDALTGLTNRRSCDLRIEEMRAKGRFPIGIIIGDVNGLKRVNDELGHEMGDVLLRIMGEAIICGSPPDSIQCRMGGDEFMVVVPETTEKHCKDIVQDIRSFLERNQEQYAFELSMSLGMALNDESTDLECTIKQADQMMYGDKQKYYCKYSAKRYN